MSWLLVSVDTACRNISCGLVEHAFMPQLIVLLDATGRGVSRDLVEHAVML